jgi:hypothetical protein
MQETTHKTKMKPIYYEARTGDIQHTIHAMTKPEKFWAMNPQSLYSGFKKTRGLAYD